MSDTSNPERKRPEDKERVDKICKSRSTKKLAEQYIKFCLSETPKRLPNIAGFFRWLKLSATARDHFKEAYEEEYKTVKMIFEDEALNSPLPPSIVSAYMKQYFSTEIGEDNSKRGEITLSFEHDIYHDGE